MTNPGDSGYPRRRSTEQAVDEIRLSHEDHLDLRSIVGKEGTACIKAMQGYGLEETLAHELDGLLHENTNFFIYVGHLDSDGQDSGEETSDEEMSIGISTTIRDERVITFIAPDTIRNFVMDAMNATEPVGGPENIAMARDTGVKMAYQVALSMGIHHYYAANFHYLRGMEAVLNIGHEDVANLAPDDYQDLLPYRLGMRLALDRLEQEAGAYYNGDPTAGPDCVELYLEHRHRALRFLNDASYAKAPLTYIDIASVLPLSKAQAAEYFSALSATLDPRNRLQQLD